jgi:tetratricopeptide (TPR) repeat protein
MPAQLSDFLSDVAAVYIGAATGGAFGSGRLIAPGLVMTAGHVVDYPAREAPARSGWKIRLLRDRTKDRTWNCPPHDAELLWRAPGDLDLALLRFSADHKPSLNPVFASYDVLGKIDEVDAAGFPEAWFGADGNLRDYTVQGSLRVAAELGPYAWSVSPADKPDDPRGWRGMSGASVCQLGQDDKLYLFGVVQQVPGNFSGGMLEVARIADGLADLDCFFHLQTALGDKPSLVRWVAATNYGLFKHAAELMERLKSAETIPDAWLARQEKLAERAAISERALATIAQRLGVENVATQDLGSALIERIDRLHLTRSNVEALPSDNPVKSVVEEAVDAGEYDRAERFLAVALEQIHAIEFIDGGKPDLAIAALNRALQQLGGACTEGSIDDRIVLGYVYKTLEQAWSAKGDPEQAKKYLAKAEEVFQALAHQTIPEGGSVVRFAEVMNGLGNLRAAQGRYQDAIGNYQVATSLLPSYAYAWHDMFLSYYQLAAQGDVRLAAMRRALDMTKQTGVGWPHLGPEKFAQLDQLIAQFE